MKAASLLFNGKQYDQKPIDITEIVSTLKEQRTRFHKQSVHHLIEYFDALSRYWDSSAFSKNLYSKNIREFLRKETLKRNMELSLRGNLDVLDKAVQYDNFPHLLHAQPRGLTVHWLAGNVSILGLFSIFSALLTKNVCLVKASSRGYSELVQLLTQLREVDTEHIKGADLLNCISVILVDRADTDAQNFISKSADIRIAWGGHEAIQSITSLEKSTHTEDIVFGPKYSYILIDSTTLDEQFYKIAQRVAVDASVFDQYACSSPHTVFVQEGNQSALDFAKELAKQMDLVHRTLIPKGETDSGKAAEILNLRTKYLFSGEVFSSKGTEWTVIYTEEPGLAKGCFSRVVVVKPIKNIHELQQLNDRQKQTLGLAVTPATKQNVLDELTLYGIDRCPDVGFMTYYEVPWDGMFIFDRMVRWVSAHK